MVRAPDAPTVVSNVPPEWLVKVSPLVTISVELLPQPLLVRLTIPLLVSLASTVSTASSEQVPFTFNVCPDAMVPSTVPAPPWATTVEAPVPV